MFEDFFSGGKIYVWRTLGILLAVVVIAIVIVKFF